MLLHTRPPARGGGAICGLAVADVKHNMSFTYSEALIGIFR
jgi:hypothetical protein